MTSIIAWDPGKVTGMAVGGFTDDTPLELGPVAALTYTDLRDGAYVLMMEADTFYIAVSDVFEHRDNDFVPDYTGIRVEGLLEAAWPDIHWRSPSKKAQVPDQVLQDHGLWYTGSQVDWEDGRDVNDAIIHMVGYVAFDLKHRPTLEAYFRG
jgi:hypothetical protein